MQFGECNPLILNKGLGEPIRSLRLLTILSRIRSESETLSGEPIVLADIGTDHGYLPIAAVNSGMIRRAIACDINPGPLGRAAENILNAGLGDRIETRLGDGLLPLEEDIADIIVIAGMGGAKILEILAQSTEKARAARLLILQPQHDWPKLREGLTQTNFKILDERLIREGNRFYIIIAAQPTADLTPWTEKECFTGRSFAAGDRAAWQEFFQQERLKTEGYIQSMKGPEHSIKRSLYTKRLAWLNEVIFEIN